MGRYYSGDIEGKFWFAVQSSDAADRFGSCGYEPSYIKYYFDKGHINKIKKEIKVIKENIGKKELEILEKFFDENAGYTEEMLINAFEKNKLTKTEEDVKFMLKEYADLGLGKKILKCINSYGECSFDAEI
tara:strand:+ start:54 stop:446 length:393 start_codon:yes stop_codon:yes gene_type:complete